MPNPFCPLSKVQMKIDEVKFASFLKNLPQFATPNYALDHLKTLTIRDQILKSDFEKEGERFGEI
jgi:hypothetical protein